jgi:acetolactate synthase-1/2/3 large subunit
MVRVADYIAQRLAAHGVRQVFLVTGGGAMHLNDAIGRCRDLAWMPCHHEQACAIAAEGYYRVHNRLAAVNVTTGPGGTNAITGVYGAFVDSIGMVVLSGQVKWETLVRSTELPLRQLGDQEIDITRLVAPVTKYAAMVTEPASVRYHLERALHLAVHGRPGPVWLDVPMNVQGAQIEPGSLRGYDPAEDALAFATRDLPAVCAQIAARLAQAQRPVVLLGSGVHHAGMARAFRPLAERLGVPVVTAFNAHDILPSAHPLVIGRQGTIGDRAGNFAVQSADLLLILGSRLPIRQISYAFRDFARGAYKVWVDIDAAELAKPTVRPDLAVHADLRAFIPAMLTAAAPAPTAAHRAYLRWCQERRERYPVVLPSYWESAAPVNPYCFVDALYRELADDEIVVTGDGTACIATFQAARVRGGQRLFSNSGCASMGYDLPAAIGACVAADRRRVVCIAGDGSLQMNLQELQTVATHRLPIKLFVLNNDGYHSIRQTQQAYFADNPIGVGPASGVGVPDYARLAHAYGLPYGRASTHEELRGAIRATLEAPGAALCEVMLDVRQPFAPKTASRRLPDGRMVSSPLEDLAPFLPREELLDNLLVPPVE